MLSSSDDELSDVSYEGICIPCECSSSEDERFTSTQPKVKTTPSKLNISCNSEECLFEPILGVNPTFFMDFSSQKRKMENEEFLNNINESLRESQRECKKIKLSEELDRKIEQELARDIAKEVASMTSEELAQSFKRSLLDGNSDTESNLDFLLTVGNTEMSFEEFSSILTFQLTKTDFERFYLFDLSRIVEQSPKQNCAITGEKCSNSINYELLKQVESCINFKCLSELTIEDVENLEEAAPLSEYEKLFQRAGIDMTTSAKSSTFETNFSLPEHLLCACKRTEIVLCKVVNLLYFKFIKDVSTQIKLGIDRKDMEKILAFLFHLLMYRTFHTVQSHLLPPITSFVGEIELPKTRRKKTAITIDLGEQQRLRSELTQCEPLNILSFEMEELFSQLCKELSGNTENVIHMILERYGFNREPINILENFNKDTLLQSISCFASPGFINFFNTRVQFKNTSLHVDMFMKQLCLIILSKSINCENVSIEEIMKCHAETTDNVLISSLKFVGDLIAKTKENKSLVMYSLYYIHSILNLVNTCFCEPVTKQAHLNRVTREECKMLIKTLTRNARSLFSATEYGGLSIYLSIITKCLYEFREISLEVEDD